MKRKKKRAKPKLCDPAICSHCTYIGDGDFICDNHPDEAVVMVLSDWEPTEHFSCTARRPSPLPREARWPVSDNCAR